MLHKMRLKNRYFNAIKDGTKRIEMRLYDEKRSLIKVGDYIEFLNLETTETLKVVVINLYKFSCFDELYAYFDKVSLGYREDEVAKASDMESFYSIEEQDKYGVLGIKIKVVD